MIEDRPDSLERLKDIEEIRALTVRYADSNLRKLFIPDLFTDDGVMDFGDAHYGMHVGRRALIEFYSAAANNLAFEAHIVANNAVMRWDGDIAEGFCITLGLAGFREYPGNYRLDIVSYHDTYARTAKGWLFKRRAITSRVPVTKLQHIPWQQEAWSEGWSTALGD